MTTIRTVLIDDESLANAGLRALLAPHADLEVVSEALSGREAVRQVAALKPDLIFLDVQMPGLNGLGVLRELMRNGGTTPAVIFVTAYDEFAVQAFEVQALDYLLKPVEGERFRRAVDRARAERGRQAPKARAEELERRLRALLAEFDEHRKAGKSGSRYRERLMVSVGTRSVIVETASIDWIGARDYCAELHVGGKSYAVRETLGALEAALDPASFVRVHRSAIINLNRVTELRRRAVRGTTVVLADGARVPVSRGRLGRLMEVLGPRQ